MHAKVKHSKVRNTGLLFEFLLRQITTDVLNKKDNSKAVQFIKKQFNENSELGKELALYNALISKKFNGEKQAEYFINEVLNERQKLNKSKLRREKYNLIKSLKEGYNVQELFSTKVKNYKTYASIYKLFEYTDLRPEEKTESFFNIVEHVTTDDKSIKLSETFGGASIPDDTELRILTYKSLLEKFNNKYSKLNASQKNLLREYINNISNTNSLKSTLKEVVKALKTDIKNNKGKLQDKVVKIKMNEALKTMDKFCGMNNKSQFVKDAHVLQTMRYMELLKELKKSDKKSTKK
tara:strand:- start:229 stop:1110 length:882 start_codon:yes stop_codon:yes gene_type:complete